MSKEPEDDVARAWGGDVVPKALAVVAALYFVGVWSEAAKSGTSARWLPSSVAYFTQIAALFPGATRHAIDYRLEGYRCKDRAWTEIDPAPWFPIDADNKENRFYRTIHFYADGRAHAQTLHALDQFIVDHYDADAIDAASQGRGGDPIGGIRIVRLRVPFGDPGDGSPRYRKTPLTEHPDDQKKDLYITTASTREDRCRRLGR